MDATRLLEQQHAEVNALFGQCKAAQGEEALGLAEEIATALAIHAEIEEEIFYPVCRSAGFASEISEAFEEHAEMKRLISQFVDLEGDDETFRSVLGNLQATVQHHVKEEEEELFPQVRTRMAAVLDDLGAQLQERAEELSEGDEIEPVIGEDATRQP